MDDGPLHITRIRTGVMEMGRKSAYCFGGDTLGIGSTEAVTYCCGTVEVKGRIVIRSNWCMRMFGEAGWGQMGSHAKLRTVLRERTVRMRAKSNWSARMFGPILHGRLSPEEDNFEERNLDDVKFIALRRNRELSGGIYKSIMEYRITTSIHPYICTT